MINEMEAMLKSLQLNLKKLDDGFQVPEDDHLKSEIYSNTFSMFS